MITFKSNSNCLRCGKNSLLTDEDTGEQFCAKCGYVISEKLEASGPEWRSFQKDEEKIYKLKENSVSYQSDIELLKLENQNKKLLISALKDRTQENREDVNQTC